MNVLEKDKKVTNLKAKRKFQEPINIRKPRKKSVPQDLREQTESNTFYLREDFLKRSVNLLVTHAIIQSYITLPKAKLS